MLQGKVHRWFMGLPGDYQKANEAPPSNIKILRFTTIFKNLLLLTYSFQTKPASPKH